MATIGSWGPDLTFSVNSEKQLLFTDMQRSVKARWATHDIRNKKPRTEFLGADQTSVTMKITFSAHRGHRPRREIQNLINACRYGDIHYLYIGGKRIGTHEHYIESIDTDWTEIWNKGELVSATCDVTFKESR
jgi:phage protein U